MDAAAYLAARARYGMKFGLGTIRALVEALGDPHRAYPSLLVAGTNGKGSVVAYLDAALRGSGMRVGRYTSPHLLRLHERIAVDGAEIPDRALEEAVARVRRVADALVDAGHAAAHPTFFEAVTAAAFEHFRTARVEVAVLEVGLGGRLDATNVSEPLASAIVSVEYDHERFLGHDLASIAREKAGVLRSGRVCVLGPLAPEARAAVEAEAARVGARLRAADEARVSRGPEGLTVETPLARYERLRTLPGAHQEANAVVALALLEEARAAGLPVDLAAAPAALASARWPGRLQWIEGDPPLLLDGAHNPAGARALAAYLEGRGPYVLVFGAMRDKDLRGMADALFPRAEAVVLTRPAAREAADPGALAALAPAGGRVEIEPDAARALAWARALARERGAFVVVAGSLYLVGEALGVAGGLAGDGLGERS
jgi:dihydrofolate synthase/folylpolyglutamate synthase